MLGLKSCKWFSRFNADKCKVLHFDHNNGQVHYAMDGNILESVEEERDLGVIIQSNLKVDKQYAKAAKTANSVVGMIRRSFINKGVGIILPLYKSLVCPRLEYCVQAWSPFLRKDIGLLEKLKKRATRMIDGFADKDYNDRLNEPDLTTLETKRKRGYLIEAFKIIQGFEDVNSEFFFHWQLIMHTQGHDLNCF